MDSNGLAISIGIVAKYATDVVLFLVKRMKWSIPSIVVHGLVVAVVCGVEFAAGKVYNIPMGIWSTITTVFSAIGYDQFSGVLAASSNGTTTPTVTPGPGGVVTKL